MNNALFLPNWTVRERSIVDGVLHVPARFDVLPESGSVSHNPTPPVGPARFRGRPPHQINGNRCFDPTWDVERLQCTVRVLAKAH